ncbi:diguanylate cyclase (GGDEF) domain-containing protein [Pseudobutyrivibrio sp. YE44]|uniref:sensor domain-containing diguanylate cyclase n=1 Tax=Pseudobutyrivibrio sp. YE44 TaxID=1520802 RepID=UPI0008822CB6|nr:diguanylate cyclase [Pseudobutyrivibrio sp. YE44]SDB22265.1 diguanylate cyclase (GGDEF) domain-containing protein [Pseudobutyrivibrio sp. YE44]
MKQYRFVVDYDCNFTEMIGSIRHLKEYNADKKGILQIFEPDCDTESIQKDLDFLTSALPKLKVIGMTGHGALSRETHSIPYRVCTILFFDKSDFNINVYDCTDVSPLEAGDQYKKALATMSDIKGILMMSSDFALCPERFIDKINEYDSSLVVFGALAGTPTMGDDRSKIFVGNKIYERAILAVAFCGKDLHLSHHYNLGFRPLGKELVVTNSNDTGIVYEIDNKPAFDIYREHLGVGMNNYFFENTSSFPLFLKENGNPLARVALDYHEDGALAFATEIPVGSSVSLSYSTADIMLDEASACALRLDDFVPEAVLIYVCMARRMLMGDNLAELEFEFYENVCPTATWGHGYGEILHADGLRGFLNASCVVIGMREGERPDEKDRVRRAPNQKFLKEYLDNYQIGFVPLPVRLVNFLESTTRDLRAAVDQLFAEATVDPLTGLYNRRALDHYMKKFIEQLGQYNGIAVMIIDIDHFKNVNDTYGHDVGDLVLKTGCEAVKYVYNQNDIIGRWGGEEFVGIKPNITQEEAMDFCETLRKNVEKMEFEVVGHITVSMGLTMIRADDTSESVFKRIDEALYEAKETGRNKVVFK